MKQYLKCGLTRGDDVSVCRCGSTLTKAEMEVVICPQCHRTNTGTTTLYHCQYCGHSLSGAPRGAVPLTAPVLSSTTGERAASEFNLFPLVVLLFYSLPSFSPGHSCLALVHQDLLWDNLAPTAI
jgi:ribosomal protein L37AE/L43A